MRSSFLLPAPGNLWSLDKIRTLRRLAQQGLSVKEIAAALHRTESAVRNKAVMQGISLRSSRKQPQLPDPNAVAPLGLPIA
jgi:hypothetical protein